MTISVLLSVYKSEKPSNLDKALQSVWFDQTLRPDEIVLIQDGPLSDSLLSVIDKWKSILCEKFVVLCNEKNLGLTKSLNKGLSIVKGDFIARMDSDDISFPNRFELQLDYMMNHPEVSVLGGGIQEIDENDNWGHLRLYPLDMKGIVKYISKANPLAHPTTFIRRSVFDKGFYYNEKYRKNQDLEFWFRLISKGFVFANLSLPVLYFRRTSDTYSKRSSFISLKSELSIYVSGIYSLYGLFTWRYIFPIIRFCVKILPSSLVRFIYKFFFKKTNL